MERAWGQTHKKSEIKRGITPVTGKEGDFMAKDGTARGGARAGSGRKSKALAEKLENGNPGGRKLTVMELPTDADLTGSDMPANGRKAARNLTPQRFLKRPGCGSRSATVKSWSVPSSSETMP